MSTVSTVAPARSSAYFTVPSAAASRRGQPPRAAAAPRGGPRPRPRASRPGCARAARRERRRRGTASAARPTARVRLPRSAASWSNERAVKLISTLMVSCRRRLRSSAREAAMAWWRGRRIAMAAVVLSAACAAPRAIAPLAAAAPRGRFDHHELHRRPLRLAGARPRRARRRLRGRLLRAAGEAHRRPRPRSSRCPRIRESAAAVLSALEAAPPAGDELAALRHQYLTRQLQSLISPRGHAVRREDDLRRGVAGAVRRGVAAPGRGPLPAHPRRARPAAARARPADRPLHRVPRRASSSRRTSWTPSSPPPSTSAAAARIPHVDLPAGRDLHRRVRDRQVLERLQLVPGRLPAA